jgi:lysophospholipase L1-like esterase
MQLTMTVKVRAFGACMIEGFPHRFEDSFFHLATERLRRESGQEIATSIYTLGGFPVPRAIKHLESRCLAEHPDLVVLQFGSSDLVVPVRKRLHLQITAERTVCAHPATLAHLLRWRIRGLIGDLFQLQPVTAPDSYLGAMDRMIRKIAATPAIPVVVSPFVFGPQRSNRFARNCTTRLRQIVAAVPQARFVEAYAALDKFPRRQILLSDGSHLTLKGQAVVAESLHDVLARILRERPPTPVSGNAAPLLPAQMPSPTVSDPTTAK